MTQRFVTAALIVLLAGGSGRAQNAPRVIVKGPEVEKRTTVVMETYDWMDSLDALKERAQRSGRLIFWLQLVGDLGDGL